MKSSAKLSVHKLAIAGILIALCVSTSPFSIPVGAARCFPVQHMINVIAAVILGPAYGVGMAFSTSLIRVLIGTGTLLAFPGSMCGALLCGIAYRYSQKLTLTFIGELVGTGVVGALLAYPIATWVMGREAALFAFVIPFGVSCLGGVMLAAIILPSLKKIGLLGKWQAQLHRRD